MIPSEFKALVDKVVNEKSKEITAKLSEKILELEHKVNSLETELKIMKEGVNL